jgi:hypothetical protein
MKKIPALLACLFFWATMFALLPDAHAQKKEEAPDKPAQKELFEAKCQKCHSLQRIKDAHLTTDKAKTIVERMSKKAGADISPVDAESINQYLSDYFVIAPSPPAVPPVPIR